MAEVPAPAIIRGLRRSCIGVGENPSIRWNRTQTARPEVAATVDEASGRAGPGEERGGRVTDVLPGHVAPSAEPEPRDVRPRGPSPGCCAPRSPARCRATGSRSGSCCRSCCRRTSTFFAPPEVPPGPSLMPRPFSASKRMLRAITPCGLALALMSDTYTLWSWFGPLVANVSWMQLRFTTQRPRLSRGPSSIWRPEVECAPQISEPREPPAGAAEDAHERLVRVAGRPGDVEAVDRPVAGVADPELAAQNRALAGKVPHAHPRVPAAGRGPELDALPVGAAADVQPLAVTQAPERMVQGPERVPAAAPRGVRAARRHVEGAAHAPGRGPSAGRPAARSPEPAAHPASSSAIASSASPAVAAIATAQVEKGADEQVEPVRRRPPQQREVERRCRAESRPRGRRRVAAPRPARTARRPSPARGRGRERRRGRSRTSGFPARGR